MTEKRVEAVERAFDLLDENRRGELPVEEIKRRFNAETHPEVISRIRTAEEVQYEFLSSFEEFCRYLKEHGGYGKITKGDFIEFYSNLNMLIADDKEFIDLLSNTWKLPSKPVLHSQKEEAKTVGTPGFAYVKSQVRRGAANISSIDNTLELGSKLYNQLQISKKSKTRSAPIENIIDTIRNKLIKRGTRGALTLFREFKVICLIIYRLWTAMIKECYRHKALRKYWRSIN